MPFLVDGHNLIPKAGLSLESPDDELELVGLLRAYSQRIRKRVDVYFDGAPAGRAGTKRFGFVTAHFVSHRSTADSAIRARLGALRGAAKNWVVVSSDAEVQAAAEAAGARTESSETFAAKLRAPESGESGAVKDSPERPSGLSDGEIREWLDVFRDG